MDIGGPTVYIFEQYIKKCHRFIERCEISQALVMINQTLYVKFDVHSTYAKHVIVLKVADRRTDRRTDQPDDDNRHPPKYW